LYTVRLELENLLSDRKIELADIKTMRCCVEELQNTLGDTSVTEKKSFIKSFVREMTVTGDEVVLNYILCRYYRIT
jgi:hypothetical protein